MKKLYPSFANPTTWRDNQQTQKIGHLEWQDVRKKTLLRDDFTCQYCGYKSEKFQIVHHLDENPENNEEGNLTTICQMCNLVEHSGQGCVVQGVVDLYKKSKFNQNDIIKITREMRDQGKNDREIIKFLGLEEKVPFKMDKEYLKKLFAFVTYRKPQGNDMYARWLEYHESNKPKLNF